MYVLRLISTETTMESVNPASTKSIRRRIRFSSDW